ncbi:MAG: GIY-YIG nuclease family protein [Candidatus Paceibacterota bacterium]
MKKHFVYMLKCADTSLYTGYTTDLTKRVREHNESRRGARYTSGRRPVVLTYTEKFATVGEALQREAAIKKLSRQAKLRLIAP